MQERQSGWSIKNAYTIITGYLPKFSLSSLPFANFFAKYHFKKPTPESIKIATSLLLAHVYRQKANEKLLNVIEQILENKKIRKKNYEQIQACLKYGADPKLTFTFESEKVPLIFLAVLYKHKNLFNYFLQRGAYSNKWTLSDVKNVNNKLLQIIKSIIESDGNKKEDWKKIKECLYHGANPDLRFGYGKFPLIRLVVKHQKKDLFELLLLLGANINDAHNILKQPLLHTFISTFNRNPEIIRIENLLESRANPNALVTGTTNNLHTTPLHLAIIRECGFDIVKPLLDYKADVNFKNGFGYTPLYHALIRDLHDEKPNTRKVIKALCIAGASLENINKLNETIFDLIYHPRQIRIYAIILKRARFDFEKENNEIIKTILLTLNRCATPLFDNKDIRFLILSKLVEDYPDKKLYEEVLSKNRYKLPPRPFLLVNQHVKRLAQIISKHPRAHIKYELLNLGLGALQENTAYFNMYYLYNLENPDKKLSFPFKNFTFDIYKKNYAAQESNTILTSSYLKKQ